MSNWSRLLVSSPKSSVPKILPFWHKCVGLGGRPVILLPNFWCFYLFFLDGIAGFPQTLNVGSKAPPFKEVVFVIIHDGG